MSVPALALAAPKSGGIPPCSPHLMPFHIAYSGPAPVSTYFRIKQNESKGSGSLAAPAVQINTPSNASTSQTQPQAQSSDSQTTLVSSSESLPTLPTSESQQTLAEDVDMLTLNGSHASPSTQTPLDAKHLTAAFRGRTVRGLPVALPEGYTGLVFSSPSPSSTSSQASAPKNSKDFKNDGEEEEEEEGESEDATRPTKLLEPTGRFTSFTLWNADIPVDEGRDEYLRALTEWTRLAAVIHQYDEDE